MIKLEEGDGCMERVPNFFRSLRDKYGEGEFRRWMSDLEFAEISDEGVTLTSESPVIVDRLNQQFRHAMLRIWNSSGPQTTTLTIRTRARLSASAAKSHGKLFLGEESAPARQESKFEVIEGGRIGSRIDVRDRLDDFAVDSSNEIAVRAARRIVDRAAAGELVYIHGPSGSGKTHLLNGIANEVLADDPSYPVAYFSYADIRDEGAAAARQGRLQEFHRRLASRELLLIDDMHRLVTSKRTQEEILNLVDAFRSAGKRVAIAGDDDPATLRDQGLNPRLADRLAGGLPAPIETAGDELRVEILAMQRARSGARCVLGDEVLEFIAATFRRSIREAIGALNQVLLIHGQEMRAISIKEVKEALATRLRSNASTVGLPDLLRAAAEVHGLTVDDLTGRAQPQRIVRARHAFNMVGREALNESFPRLGAVLDRDHTTIMSSYDRAQALHERCDTFRGKVAAIRERLGL